MINRDFPLRKDRYGYRYVFFLGNEGGNCKYQCRFCEIGKSNAVDSTYNIMLFDYLYNDFKLKLRNETTHPLLYNRGNITDEKSCSRKTLTHILNKFKSDTNIHHLSINSREKEADANFMDYIMNFKLSFPIHFILGQESFSSKTTEIIGKNTVAEFDSLVKKISLYNYISDSKTYIFGIDVNLLFLPELYIGNAKRKGNEVDIFAGLHKDIDYAINTSTDSFPLTININPYYKVNTLPYENADIEHFISLLPPISEHIYEINKNRRFEVSVFVGFRPVKMFDNLHNKEIVEFESVIDEFNEMQKAVHTHP